MTQDLTPFFGPVTDAVLVGIVVFLRIGAALAVLPAFGERGVPMRVRIAIGIAFTLIVAPAIAPSVLPRVSQGTLPLHFFFTEAAAGLVLGLGIRMFIFILQTAGEMAAQSASLAQIFAGSNTTEALPAFGNLFLFSGLALATLAGLHIKVATAFILSYQIFPLGELTAASTLTEWGIHRVSRVFSFAFSLAAPFIIVSLVYNLALGVINRAMPQLMVAFVGAPAISGGGIIILFLTLPTILAIWLASFDAFLADPTILR